MINIKSFNNPKGYTTKEQIMCSLRHCEAMIKHTSGIVNAMSNYSMLDAIDAIKKEGLYEHNVKRNFNKAMEQHRKYESRLLNPATHEQRFFDVTKFSEDRRRYYRADITNEDIFKMWLDMGVFAYSKIKPMTDSLCHKYYKSLIDNKVNHAKAIAWVLTAEMSLEIAVEAYDSVAETLSSLQGIMKQDIKDEFNPFSLLQVQEAWCEAMLTIYPQVEEYKTKALEDRNIALGIKDLKDSLSVQFASVDAIREGYEDNASLFATKGFYRKNMSRVSEAEQELINQKAS